MIPPCPHHGAQAMTEMLMVGAPGWYTCTAPGLSGPCGYSAWEITEANVLISSRDNPIVPNAKWNVRCACSYAHDSAADTPEAARADVSARHDPACGTGLWTVTPIQPIQAQGEPSRVAALEAVVSRLADTLTRLEAAQPTQRLDQVEAALAGLAESTNRVLAHLERIAKEHT